MSSNMLSGPIPAQLASISGLEVPEADIDPWSVRVVVPAALGAAAPAGSSGPGTVNYRAAGAGVDVVIYAACDRFSQCTSAELVVVSLDDR